MDKNPHNQRDSRGIQNQRNSHDPQNPYLSYIYGFVGSMVVTLLAYLTVKLGFISDMSLVLAIASLAVLQLVIQVVFFLHLGQGSRWKMVSFIFTLLVVGIVVVGSIWVMNHLNYNMMDMTPTEQNQYMTEHEGI